MQLPVILHLSALATILCVLFSFLSAEYECPDVTANLGSLVDIKNTVTPLIIGNKVSGTLKCLDTTTFSHGQTIQLPLSYCPKGFFDNTRLVQDRINALCVSEETAKRIVSLIAKDDESYLPLFVRSEYIEESVSFEDGKLKLLSRNNLAAGSPLFTSRSTFINEKNLWVAYALPGLRSRKLVAFISLFELIPFASSENNSIDEKELWSVALSSTPTHTLKQGNLVSFFNDITVSSLHFKTVSFSQLPTDCMCPICQEELDITDSSPFSCGHWLHETCKRLLRETHGEICPCPICRSKVVVS